MTYLRLHILAVVVLGIAAEQVAASEPTTRPEVGIYPLQDRQIDAIAPSQTPLADLRLAAKPILGSEDILYYDQLTKEFYISREAAERAVGEIGAAYGKSVSGPGWRKWSIPIPFVPVVVAVNGRPEFLAALGGDDSVFQVAWPTEIPATQPISKGPVVSKREMTLTQSAYSLTLFSPWGKADDADPRDSAVFLGALKDSGKLDSWTLAKPRMTVAEAKAAGRRMNMHYREGDSRTPPQSMPDDWSVAEVGFCKVAMATVPSRNILGFEWMRPLHCVWIIRFLPPDNDAAVSGKFGKVAQMRAHEGEWCVVDDATGQALRIRHPLYARSLPVEGADQLRIGPIATEDEVREAAKRELSQIDRVVFLESIEVRFEATRDPNSRLWTQWKRVWLCEGKDVAGAERVVPLTDRVPGYRPPEIYYRKLPEIRRPTPAKE